MCRCVEARGCHWLSSLTACHFLRQGLLLNQHSPIQLIFLASLGISCLSCQMPGLQAGADFYVGYDLNSVWVVCPVSMVRLLAWKVPTGRSLVNMEVALLASLFWEIAIFLNLCEAGLYLTPHVVVFFLCVGVLNFLMTRSGSVYYPHGSQVPKRLPHWMQPSWIGRPLPELLGFQV